MDISFVDAISVDATHVRGLEDRLSLVNVDERDAVVCDEDLERLESSGKGSICETGEAGGRKRSTLDSREFLAVKPCGEVDRWTPSYHVISARRWKSSSSWKDKGQRKGDGFSAEITEPESEIDEDESDIEVKVGVPTGGGLLL